MGQYYKPIILSEDKKSVKSFMYSHDYGNGLKLMEHSYIGNSFVSAFESLLINNPQPVIWAGDYGKTKFYQKCDDNLKTKPSTQETKKYKFIINHTKKLFVNKENTSDDPNNWRIHPLPLLTADGNGQGGGDFYGEDLNGLVGSWATDVISISETQPENYEELIFNLIED